MQKSAMHQRQFCIDNSGGTLGSPREDDRDFCSAPDAAEIPVLEPKSWLSDSSSRRVLTGTVADGDRSLSPDNHSGIR